MIAEGSTSSVRVSSHGGHAAGDVLAGKYRIIGFLGEGGMGTVWRAHSLLLDVDVAIKVLHGEHADARPSARLLREARATASLEHPAIVRILDFGETDAGEPFLVMELLEGISLADWIDGNGRMPAADAVRTLLPIADALVVAHAHGIVHRDVKPDNILLVPDGVGTYLPKILDFGIAKLLTTESGRVLTEAGAVLGSLEYMSPEQAEGKLEVGEQTDVWALSVVLYELIAGRRPFAGSNLTAILASLRRAHPTPTMQLAAGDEELWEIIARGLQRSPAERWRDMRAFGAALAFWAVRHGITTDATGTSLTHHWLATPSQPPDGRSSSAPVAAAPMRVDSPVPARDRHDRDCLRRRVDTTPAPDEGHPRHRGRRPRDGAGVARGGAVRASRRWRRAPRRLRRGPRGRGSDDGDARLRSPPREQHARAERRSDRERERRGAADPRSRSPGHARGSAEVRTDGHAAPRSPEFLR